MERLNAQNAEDFFTVETGIQMVWHCGTENAMKVDKYAFANGIILDGKKGMEPVRDRIIFTEDKKIAAVKPKGSDMTGYETVDLGGSYIMPGLINLHVHIPASGKPKAKETDVRKLVKKVTSNALMRYLSYRLCVSYVKPELYSGVTTIRTVGGILDYDSRLRDDIAAGKITGPRIIAGNMAVSVPGGHMAGSLAYEAKSAEEARMYVEKIAADKPDLIKLMITGGVLDATKKGEPGKLKMPPEYVRAACEEAHKAGLHVAAHVESTEGVRVALENGVDTIEHGAKPDEEIINLFKERNASLVTTISPALPYALFDRSVSHATEEQQYNGKIVFDGILECARACLSEKIPVGLGTDTGCPFITHYDMWREIYYFHKYCGVSNSFALHTATEGNAKILGMQDRLGTIEEGKCADMIVTKNNPLEDLKALRNVSMVIAGGRITDHSKLKKYRKVEEELDKFLD